MKLKILNARLDHEKPYDDHIKQCQTILYDTDKYYAHISTMLALAKKEQNAQYANKSKRRFKTRSSNQRFLTGFPQLKRL